MHRILFCRIQENPVKSKLPNRKILVVLSNRFDRNSKKRFLELDADEKGNILKEKKLKSEPRKPLFDEVWENDEGKIDMASCNRFSRKYRHRLEKPKSAAPAKKKA
jgi:hypothetical protein